MSILLESSDKTVVSAEKTGISTIDATQLLSDGKAALTAMTTTTDQSNKDVCAMLGGCTITGIDSSLSIKNIDTAKPIILAKDDCNEIYKEAQSTGDPDFADAERKACAQRNATEGTILDKKNSHYIGNEGPKQIINDLMHWKGDHGSEHKNGGHGGELKDTWHTKMQKDLYKLCEMDIKKANDGEKKYEKAASMCIEENLRGGF